MHKVATVGSVLCAALTGCAVKTSYWDNFPSSTEYSYRDFTYSRVLENERAGFASWLRCDLGELDIKILKEAPTFANDYVVVSCPSKGIDNVRCVTADGLMFFQCMNSRGEILQVSKYPYFEY